jgi:pyruvate dehydrogenase E2 component (dihydrolipoamide acetyltransferase)
MQQSKLTAPHFYLQASFNAAAAIALRDAARPEKVAWDAFFVRAAARAVKRFPRMAARFENDHLVAAGTDAIGVAVDLDGDLFVVPVAEAADRSALHISRQIRQDVERLRSGDSGARRLHPAVMTITNLGACNVEAFIPIINPPESAILAIGKIAPAVVAVDGMIAVQQRGRLTLAVDHRVANGKYAADFLGAIVRELETM